jgi:hypothetical protein
VPTDLKVAHISSKNMLDLTSVKLISAINRSTGLLSGMRNSIFDFFHFVLPSHLIMPYQNGWADNDQLNNFKRLAML